MKYFGSIVSRRLYSIDEDSDSFVKQYADPNNLTPFMGPNCPLRPIGGGNRTYLILDAGRDRVHASMRGITVLTNTVDAVCGDRTTAEVINSIRYSRE